jgi:hypothetical protein
MAVFAAWPLAVLVGCARAPAQQSVSATDGQENVSPSAKAPQLPPTGAPPSTFPVLKEPTKSEPPPARTPAAPAKELTEVLEYVGAFRLPGGKLGDSTFDYGGTAVAFNQSNNSLFMVGHDWDQAVAEVKIPETVVNSGKLDDLPTAKLLQPFAKVLDRVPNFTLKDHPKIGGLMVADGRLIGTVYEFYDAEGKTIESHFRLDSLDLSSAKGEGLFRVGTLGGGFVGGYMAHVPPEWQEKLGARYVTGQAALAIIGRTSSGPAAFGFDPKNFGRNTTPVTPLVYYPLKTPLGRMDAKNDFFNGCTNINGIFFVPGSRTVLFFGSHGTGEIGYGEAATFKDEARDGKGFHSRDGKYEYQVWAYDVLDLVAVKEKKKQPWQIKPYAVWHPRFPIDDAAKRIGGVAFDPGAGRLYVSQLAGQRGKFEVMPLIHVFKLAAGGR